MARTDDNEDDDAPPHGVTITYAQAAQMFAQSLLTLSQLAYHNEDMREGYKVLARAIVARAVFEMQPLTPTPVDTGDSVAVH